MLSGGESGFLVVQIIWFQVSLVLGWMFVDFESGSIGQIYLHDTLVVGCGVG